VDPVAEAVVGFLIAAADDAVLVGNEQGAEGELGVVGKAMAGEDSGRDVASTSCEYRGA